MLNLEQAKRIKSLIEEHDHIVLFHHVNPDGDCMATSFGLAKALRDNYPTKEIKVAANIEDFTPHLRYMDDYIDWDNTINTPEHNDYLLIIGDVSGENRVNLLDKFYDSAKSIVVYDHHENPITIKNYVEFWSEPDYPAAALMAFQLLRGMELEITKEAAIILYHGILTDTRWFRLAPADRKSFDIAGELGQIVGQQEITNLHNKMKRRSINDLKFEGWVLENFITIENKVAYLKVTKEDLDRFGYKPDQGARIDLLNDIEGIESWLFFIQYENNVRVELQSKNIHVDEIATEFGGGGHHHRAGTRLSNMDEAELVVNRVIEVIKSKGL